MATKKFMMPYLLIKLFKNHSKLTNVCVFLIYFNLFDKFTQPLTCKRYCPQSQNHPTSPPGDLAQGTQGRRRREEWTKLD